MKALLLALFLTVGCSVSNYYKAPEVASELEKNETRLLTVAAFVTSDFNQKEQFLDFYSNQSLEKDQYILTDLQWRLWELKSKRDAILTQVARIKSLNDRLLTKVQGKTRIQERTALFNKIESFTAVTKTEAQSLFKNLETYKKSSDDFVRFSVLTRNTFMKSTRVQDRGQL